MNQKNSLGLNKCFLDLDNPFELFQKWFEEAKKKEINDPREKMYSFCTMFWVKINYFKPETQKGKEIIQIMVKNDNNKTKHSNLTKRSKYKNNRNIFERWNRKCKKND